LSGEIRLIDAVGSEKESPIFVFTIASPQRLQYSVANRMRSWMNCPRCRAAYLRVPHQHRDGPRTDRDSADGRRELARPGRRKLQESGEPRVLQGVRDLQARERALVLLEDVGLDGRDDVVRVLDPAAGGFGLLGEIVVGQDHVRLVAVEVVEHRLMALDGVVQYSSIDRPSSVPAKEATIG
jgi:hypothetical protein